MKVKDLVSAIDKFAPFFLQESYDNSGLQIGDSEEDITKIAVALEATKESVEFAIRNSANVLVTHHPLIFFPVKTVTKRHNPVLFEALRNGLNIVSAHTNFDIAENGLNDYVGKMLGIRKTRPLKEANEKVFKLAFYVPEDYADKVRSAVFEAGAGKIGNYDMASFNIRGEGTFRPMEGANPFIGEPYKLEHVNETKVETVVTQRNLGSVLNALLSSHPYEEPAYDIYEISLRHRFGIGMLGTLEKETSLSDFAKFVRKKLSASYVKVTRSSEKPVKTVALCIGAGGSLLEDAARSGADVFVTGDITYHTAMRAKELGLNIIDAGHFNTEKFFPDVMLSLLKGSIEGVEVVKFSDEEGPFQIL